MSRHLFGSKLPSLSLCPIGGEIYAHVFENPRRSISRNLFWNMTINFEPVTAEDAEWDCSFGTDWLTWPVHAWPELDGMNLDKVIMPDMVESSLYIMAEHHPATLKELRLSGRKGATFEAAITASAHVGTDNGQRTIPVSFVCRLQFAGIIVVDNKLGRMPSNSALAAAAVAEFIQLSGLRNPRSEGWRYVLEPEA